MKILIAPQAFKNCASASLIAKTIARGVLKAAPEAILTLCPIADGGDNTLEILMNAKKGVYKQSIVTGANGNTCRAAWGVISNKEEIAIIESALICGLSTLTKSQYNPSMTTTYGIGELIKEILDKGYKKIFIGLGGSATNDAGAGIAQALGVRLLDSSGKELPKGGAALLHLKHIDLSRKDPRLKNIEILVGCDVNNPLLGTTGATHVYARQKGASPEVISILEDSLANFAFIIQKEMGVDISSIPFAGAAGSTAAGLFAFCDAKLISGAEWILETLEFANLLQGVDLVITGEGRMDDQTAFQKAPSLVARLAKAQNIPVIAIVGSLTIAGQSLQGKIFDAIFSASAFSEEIPCNALELIEKAAENAVTIGL